MSIFEVIKARRSVRTFNGDALSKEDAERIESFAASASNPYGIDIDIRLLDAKEHGMSSSVIAGESAYLAGKVKRVPHAEEAFGYTFEKVLLFAESTGVSNVWLAGTFDKKAALRAMSPEEDEVLPAVSPLGYKADKMSLRETVMRKGTKADRRIPFGELFFDEKLEPLKEGKDPITYALEAVRLAPSAVNRQPWRAVFDGSAAHFYKAAGRGSFDLHKIDLGIALCHFDAVLEECGVGHVFSLSDPGIDFPGAEYVASYLIK